MAWPFESRTQTKTPRGSPGKLGYVIGDVHGRLDLLDSLLSKIAVHRRAFSDSEAHVILLGDVIDRGPDSRGVLNRLRAGLAFDAKLHILKGNHEEMMVDALSGATHRLQSWLSSGGYACARSYGVEVGGLFGEDPTTLEARLLASIPQTDIAFLDSFLDCISFGDYFFAHAGVRPGRAIDEQTAQDLRWIRAPFLRSNADHGAVVVHGHSVTLEVEERRNRIGIDTGAWKTGVLTALWIREDRRGLIQANGDPMPEDGWHQ